MKARWIVGLFGAALLFGPGGAVAELRPAEMRPEVMEIDNPVMISRSQLGREMKFNPELRDWIDRYGWPDYAEVQEVTVNEPLAAYEVRIYYLRRNQQLAFSRVYVSPALVDFGIRVYEGAISPDTIDRLLTAIPADQPIGTSVAEGDSAHPGDPVDVAVRAIDSGADPMKKVEESLKRSERPAPRQTLD